MNLFHQAAAILNAHEALVHSIKFRESIRDGLLIRLMEKSLHRLRMTEAFASLSSSHQQSVMSAQADLSVHEALELLVLLLERMEGEQSALAGSDGDQELVAEVLRFLHEDQRQFVFDFMKNWVGRGYVLPTSASSSKEHSHDNSLVSSASIQELKSTTPDAPLEPFGAPETPPAQQLKG